MSTPSYKRDPIAYRREVMARTAAAGTGYSWAVSEQAFCDFVLTKRGTSRTHLIIAKVYECMAPSTGDLCIDASDWVQGWVTARALACSFAVIRRTPKGVQMMVHGVDNDGKRVDTEWAGGVIEVRIPAEWFGAEIELPNGQTWADLRVPE